MDEKVEKTYSVRTAPIAWTGMGLGSHTALQYYVSVDGIEKYIFDFEDHGVDSKKKAIALAKSFEAEE